MQRATSQDTDSDEDVPDELKQDFVDEKTGDDAHHIAKRYAYYAIYFLPGVAWGVSPFHPIPI
jgi:hypothetical protein